MAKAVFSLTILEMLLSAGRSVLRPSQPGRASKGITVSVKNQENSGNLLKLLEKWFTYNLTRFWMVFNNFWFCLILSATEKLKNSIFEMPIIIQTLNFNNLRTTNVKSINLHTIRKLMECSLKSVFKSNIDSYGL